MHLIGFLLRAAELEWKSAQKDRGIIFPHKLSQCTLQVSGNTLQQVDKFKCLGLVSTSDGKLNKEIDARVSEASAVLRELHRSVLKKRELSNTAKLYLKLFFISILNYGPESYITTEKWFFPTSTRRDTLGQSAQLWNSKIPDVEPLILQIERSQLCWFGHVTKMSQKKLSRHVLLATSTGKRPRSSKDQVEWPKFPTLLGPVMAWGQQNYHRFLSTVRYFESS